MIHYNTECMKIRSATPFLSVVIPLYNESLRVDHGIKRICFYCKKQKFTTEIIVVNDGSMDNTLAKLHALQRSIPLTIVSYPMNRGKGYAVKIGMLKSRGNFRLFTDIDLSTPIEEFDTMLPLLNSFDIIIGSRRTTGSHVFTRQPIIRETLGRSFTFLSRIILQIPVSDFTCGFKCFSSRCAEYIFSRCVVDRWGFDSEILFLASRKGFSFREIPVVWNNDARTKVVFPDDAIRSLVDLLKIRIHRYQ